MTVAFLDSSALGRVSETIDFTFTEGTEELVIAVIYEPSGIAECAYINGAFTALYSRSTFDGPTCRLRRRTRWPGDFQVAVREGTLAITYSPTNYTAATPTSADSHLEGIDDALAERSLKVTKGTDITTSATLSASDADTRRKVTGNNVTVSISGTAGHALDDVIVVYHRGTGTLTFSGTNGMTVNRPAGTAATAYDVGSWVAIVFDSATECHLVGRLTPS